jgi:hypothetical protein
LAFLVSCTRRAGVVPLTSLAVPNPGTYCPKVPVGWSLKVREATSTGTVEPISSAPEAVDTPNVSSTTSLSLRERPASTGKVLPRTAELSCFSFRK